jgi:hypothetical protein
MGRFNECANRPIYLRSPVDAIVVALCKITIGIVMDDDSVKHNVVWTARIIRVVGEKDESMTNRRLKRQAQLGQIIDGARRSSE